MPELAHALQLAAAGITVVCTSGLLAVIYAVVSPLEGEVRDDSRQRPL